jgi:hypothetical protein
MDSDLSTSTVLSQGFSEILKIPFYSDKSETHLFTRSDLSEFVLPKLHSRFPKFFLMECFVWCIDQTKDQVQ